LRSRLLECSNEEQHWDAIDRQSKAGHFKGDLATATISVSPVAEACFIRLVQTGGITVTTIRFR
jgi:hypothetical protein